MPKTTLSTTLIKATGINRYYGDTQAVKDLSFELNSGDILGFLGPNGAGKSTSMQILSGTLAPDSGSIEINGIDLIEHPTQAKQQLGYLPEQPPLYKELTVNEYLSYSASLRGIKKEQQASAIDTAKQRCGLTEVGNKLINNLSKGYQQRVGIAQAIIHNPSVIILDEPTVGLDPIQIQEIRQLITELGQHHAVIISTHILPEVLAVCNRVQIIRQGELVYSNDMQSIATDSQTNQLELSFKNTPDLNTLENIPGVSIVEKLSDTDFCLELSTDNNEAEQSMNALLSKAVEKNWQPIKMQPRLRSLEQIFIDLTLHDNSSNTDEDTAE